ncbi:sensor histidine kinase [Paenibacillus daejeonensis]|uniref:sensor histidine kinase n=1 Tax=Paenibacillus daejeonensis TaxID=135193 RepID=UPI00037D8DBC|nr:histidine kinase [Paenibacillus daejeonensis]
MKPKLLERWSLALWLLVCGITFCTFLPALLIDQDSRMDRGREPFAALTREWEVGWGSQQPAAGGWQPLDAEARAVLDDYAGVVWLQRSLPELPWRSPYLLFSQMPRFEAWLDGEPLYRFNVDGKQKFINPLKSMHPVPVGGDARGQQLLIRAVWDGETLFGHDMVLAGELDQVLYALLHAELSYLLYGLLSVTTGVVGMVLAIRRREALYGWFALFAGSIGGAFLLSCRSLQWFVPMQGVYYWQELLTPIAIWACFSFYAAALYADNPKLHQAIHLAAALYMILAVSTAIWLPRLFLAVAPDVHAMLAFAGFAVITCALAGFAVVTYSWVRSPWRRVQQPHNQREERTWLMRGYWTFTLCALVSLGAAMFPGLLTHLLNTHSYLYRVFEGLLPNGLLLFMICMVMFMISRMRRIHLEAERSASELLAKHQELALFHRNLEGLVETRTAELEKTNRTLAVTLREKAETLAEMSVLEERNRIAYEMHDGVGHTLTAAIVQLEATKRLTERNGAMPTEKLDLLSGLVRKGLDDIRRTVRLMKSDEVQPLSLEASLRELLQYTEDTMEIRIDAEIILPDDLELGRLTEQTLYHALQEGLTNAIRHGRCTHARFTLQVVRDLLQFRLVSDGEPFGAAAPGFGLNSMTERVELLGGEVLIRSDEDESGSPRGCRLSINLPVA